MGLEERIGQLERKYGSSGPRPPASVPSAWAEFDDDGRLIGPPPGEPLSGRQQRALDELAVLDASVPIF
jgi:hypothetical protein